MRKFNKLFGVGLNRTGTSSLHEALKMLDISSIHASTTLWERVELNRLMTWPLLTGMESTKAFLDHPVDWLYKELDRHYPNSIFVYTWRDLSSWMKSRIWLAEWVGTKIDETTLIRLWHNHSHEVAEYFKNRQDVFLEINICAGEGWEKLCPFLDVDMKVEPFPHIGARASALKG